MEGSTATLLKHVPLFSALDDASLQTLAQRCRKRRFAAHASLFHEGDAGHTLYLIISGRVDIQTTTASGETVHLAERGPGEPVGEMALIDGKPRMADAVTGTITDLLMLDRDDFIKCIEISPRIALGVMSCLADRIRQAANLLESQQALDVLGRVAELILGLASVHGVTAQDGTIKILTRVTQQHMADRLGTTRESVNRALSSLKRVRAIRMDGRQIIVTAPTKLRQYCT